MYWYLLNLDLFVEGGFISSPNAFKQTLGLLCHNYGFVNPSWDVLHDYCCYLTGNASFPDQRYFKDYC